MTKFIDNVTVITADWLNRVDGKLSGYLSVTEYGVTGSGTDEGAKVQQAINDAIAANHKIVLDFAGLTIATSVSLSIPPGGHVSFKNGKLVALPNFPTDDYVLKANSQLGGLVHHDLDFDLEIDGAHVANCLLLDNYIRVFVAGTCRFLHFKSVGVQLDKTLDSHEATLADGVSAFEYLYGEPGWVSPSPTSVGFQINSFDNSIGDVVSYYTGTGMVVNGQYNRVTKAHLGGVQYALKITDLAAFSSFSQIYIDSAAVLWENPWNTEITGGKFLHNTSDASFAFIVFKPKSAGLALNGIKVTNCSFHNIGATMVQSMKTDTSSGSFNPAYVLSCYIGENSFANTTYAYTRVMTSLYKTASTTWTIDLNGYFPFGTIQKAVHSFYDASGSNPISNITAIGSASVTVTNSVAGNGTVFLEVDVNTVTS
jgi:hypothetical protein